MKNRYPTMNLKLLLLVFVFPITAFGKENCSPETLDINKTTHIVESLFYTGTCHYRNEDYDLAAEYWRELAELEDVDADFEELQISSLNNLGYLMFFGYGLEKDHASAIEYWSKAVSLGHEESEYHLCHAYADKDEGTYNLHRGIAHCKKAWAIYQSKKEKDDGDKEILRLIEFYQESLESR